MTISNYTCHTSHPSPESSDIADDRPSDCGIFPKITFPGIHWSLTGIKPRNPKNQVRDTKYGGHRGEAAHHRSARAASQVSDDGGERKASLPLLWRERVNPSLYLGTKSCSRAQPKGSLITAHPHVYSLHAVLDEGGDEWDLWEGSEGCCTGCIVYSAV